MLTSSKALNWAISAAVAMWGAGAAVAQISSSDQAALAHQGFTASDFRAFETTQIAPAFRPFVDWRNCVRAAAAPTIQQRSVAETRDIVFGLCEDQEATARSVIAARTGLSAANRIMALARAIEANRIEGLFASFHPPAPAGTTSIAGWQARLGPNSCSAVFTTRDLFAPGALLFEARPGQNTPNMALILRGDVATDALRGEVPRDMVSALVSFQGNAGRSLGPIKLKVVDLGSGGVGLFGVPSPAQFEVLKTGTAVQVNGGLSGPITLQAPDVGTVWDALRKCISTVSPAHP